jgi:FixJ family two-component response regulator
MHKAALIAIVDDDKAIRLGLSSLARSEGYTVKLFASAEAFLAQLATTAFDCLVTDVQMPGISGLELQQILKLTHPKLPVIVMTAYPEQSIRDKAIAAGAIYFLNKPFDAATILRCIADAIAPVM